jgi:hypothetical protein
MYCMRRSNFSRKPGTVLLMNEKAMPVAFATRSSHEAPCLEKPSPNSMAAIRTPDMRAPVMADS